MRTPAIGLLSFLTAGLMAGPALADSHAVTVRNGTAETIRLIQISPTPGAGENRLRSQLPPGASGRIGYSTGCLANVRLGFDSGRTEDHGGVDVCTDPLVVAGTAGVAGPAVPVSAGVNTSVSRTAALKPAANAVKLAPPPVVPPWTGKSITKRFGGMD